MRGGATILPGFISPFGSSQDLISRERRREPRPEEGRDPFGAHQPVAVLAGIGALVLLHHRAGFLGDGAHLLGAVAAHVEDRSHVQRADRGVRVPGAARAVLLEDVGQPLGVLGEVLERHRAILDEGDGLAVALHGHHDVQAGLAHFPHSALQAGVGDLDHAARVAEIGHQLREFPELARTCSSANSTSRMASGSPLMNALTVRSNAGISRARPIMVRSTSSTAVGLSLTMCCVTSIAGRSAREVAHAERARPGQRRELQVQALRPRERSLRAHQQVRGVRVRRAKVIEVVAGDLAQHLGEARFDLRLLPTEKPFELFHELLILPGPRAVVHRPEAPAMALRRDGVDGEHVVHHVPVGDRARAAGIVAGHAAERGLRAGRHIDRKPQPVRAQARVERIEHHAGLHHRCNGFRAHFQDVVLGTSYGR